MTPVRLWQLLNLNKIGQEHELSFSFSFSLSPELFLVLDYIFHRYIG